MQLKKENTRLILLVLLSLGVSLNANATHISEPILNESRTEYRLGEKIVISGWVSYNNQPTADVLLAFKVLSPDESIATEMSYPSDNRGQFVFEFDTKNQTPGKYQITVTSHCLEIHRPICTYKNQKLSIDITK